MESNVKLQNLLSFQMHGGQVITELSNNIATSYFETVKAFLHLCIHTRNNDGNFAPLITNNLAIRANYIRKLSGPLNGHLLPSYSGSVITKS